MSTSTDCQVCSVQPSKYKCPKCRLRYCSVPCFKGHDCLAPSEPQKIESIVEPNALATEDKKELEIPEEEQLLPAHIASLLSSSQIQQALSSSSLGQVIRHIDSASTQEEAIKRLKKAQEGHPEFQSFANQALDILDIARDNPPKP